ncbi:MAG TPA: hypothetical protein VGC82_12770, partial [Rhodopila sp.]
MFPDLKFAATNEHQVSSNQSFGKCITRLQRLSGLRIHQCPESEVRHIRRTSVSRHPLFVFSGLLIPRV